MSEPSDAGPVRYSGEFTSGPEFARRLAYAVLNTALLRPAQVVPRLILVALLLAGGLIIDLSSPDGWQGLLVAVCVIVLLVLPALIAYPVTVRVSRNRIPVGSTYCLELRDRNLTLTSPEVSTTVAYGYYQSCDKRGTFVRLRQRITRRYQLLPIELFTDESYDFLLAHIQPVKAAATQLA